MKTGAGLVFVCENRSGQAAEMIGGCRANAFDLHDRLHESFHACWRIAILSLLVTSAPVQGAELNVAAPSSVAVASDSLPVDATSFVQGLLNAGIAVLLPCNVPTNVTGLTVPKGGASIRGECPSAVLHVTTNMPALSCSGAKLSVTDLTITGTAANYTDHGTGPSDAGQHGIAAVNCPEVRVRNVRINNLSGAGIDYQFPSGAFSVAQTSLFSDISVNNSYHGVHTWNFGEYATFANVQVKNNVFGIEVESGNVSFSNVIAQFNSIGIKINGQANQNPCHGTFSGGSANHNTHNLIIISCGLGQVFNGMDFIADQAGGISRGSKGIQIYNSRGITIANGQIGTNVLLEAADPLSGSSALNGANLLFGNFIRDDLPNFVVPTVAGMPAMLLKKDNYNASGFVWWNN
jgi:hypothetical protein